MIPRGVNVDPTNPNGAPDPKILKARGFNAVRLVCQPPAGGVVEQYAKRCKDAGLFVLAVVAHESGGYLIANADLYQLGNEPDGQPPSSWVQTPDEYVQLWNLFRGTYPDLPFIAAGLCSGDVSWWAQVAPHLDGCQGVAVHPYGKDLGAAKALLEAYRAVRTDVGLYVTEWNRPAAEIPGYDWWLRSNTAGAWWFCWSDGMVGGFGLLDAAGAPKPELGQFRPIPAATRPTTRVPAPPIVYKLLDASHYDYSSTPRNGLKIAGACNHIADGYGSLYGWFASQQLSTNYWIGRDGRIECYVADEHAAYGQGLISLGSEFPTDFVRACGGTVSSPSQGYLANCLYLSIEHEGHPQDGLTAAQLARSRWLNRWLAQEHGYPFDANHVVGHYRFDHISRARCGRMVPQILGAAGNGAA